MADSQFISNSTVTYDVASSGVTTVTHDITLQNKSSDFYATSYTLSLSGITPLNPVAVENGDSLPVKVTQNKDSNTTSMEVDFTTPVVGKDSKREFSISFQDKTLIAKSGEIWEITTPKLSDQTSFDFYSSIIKVPTSFGQLAYISPTPSFKGNENGKMIFSFDKATSVKNAVTAAFGNFQVFSFDLTYHIENPLNGPAETEVALPPDTNYQKMNYTNISPQPTKIRIDNDGNWLATFSLKAHEKVDVKAEGAVQLFADSVEFPKIDKKEVINNLAATSLWQTKDPKIQALAVKYKTPKQIYDYVVSTLSYDYQKQVPDVQRLGAVAALNDPKAAICTEFTDLFIAIARAAGIPAREIEGYAYTDNPEVQPLSLVADVLHAWPEYWDKDKQIWIAVDPTWGSTSQIDYFSKLDLRHFAFVIHGSDPKKPYPAGSYKIGDNPQKDVQVNFGQLPTKRVSNLKITNSILSELPFSDEIVNTKIKNEGPVAVYNYDLKIQYDNSKIAKEIKIDVIPPYGYYETKIEIPYSFLGQRTPAKIGVLINDSKQSEFDTYKVYVTISNLLMILLFVFFIIVLAYLKFKDVTSKQKSSSPSA